MKKRKFQFNIMEYLFYTTCISIVWIMKFQNSLLNLINHLSDFFQELDFLWIIFIFFVLYEIIVLSMFFSNLNKVF
jgi:hypothetical protein